LGIIRIELSLDIVYLMTRTMGTTCLYSQP
jgi:hypothetical protein